MEKNYIKNKITGEQIPSPLDFEVAENDCPKYVSWNEAVKIANQMGEDWRLPTKTEIELLKEYKLVFGLDKRVYWTNEVEENMAYSKSFKWYLPSRFVVKQSTCGVRFVRTSQANIELKKDENPNVIPLSDNIIRIHD